MLVADRVFHLCGLVFLLLCVASRFVFFFFFQAEDGIRDADVTGVQTCALPIFELLNELIIPAGVNRTEILLLDKQGNGVKPLEKVIPLMRVGFKLLQGFPNQPDRKSTRLNSSHVRISYAVFCLKKKILAASVPT